MLLNEPKPSLTFVKPKNSRDIWKEYIRCQQFLALFSFVVHAFVELDLQLLQMDDVDIFLSDKLNQDPLEGHFEMVSSGSGVSENPTQEKFGQLNRKIVPVKSDMIQVSRSNTRGRFWENVAMGIHDEHQLPKWSKKIWIRLHCLSPFVRF